MKIIGITGAPASGKSRVLKEFRAQGVPSWSADEAVHALFLEPKIQAEIETLFPGCVSHGVVDRKKLAEKAFATPAALRALEAILHQDVRAQCKAFIGAQRRSGRKKIALEIPLLFEGNYDRLCDRVLLIDTPDYIRRNRIRTRGVSKQREKQTRARIFRTEKRKKLSDQTLHSAHETPEFKRALRKYIQA